MNFVECLSEKNFFYFKFRIMEEQNQEQECADTDVEEIVATLASTTTGPIVDISSNAPVTGDPRSPENVVLFEGEK
jgi:hypothetical protein